MARAEPRTSLRRLMLRSKAHAVLLVHRPQPCTVLVAGTAAGPLVQHCARPRCQQRGCTVGTWVGATVGSGGARPSARAVSGPLRRHAARAAARAGGRAGAASGAERAQTVRVLLEGEPIALAARQQRRGARDKAGELEEHEGERRAAQCRLWAPRARRHPAAAAGWRRRGARRSRRSSRGLGSGGRGGRRAGRCAWARAAGLLGAESLLGGPQRPRELGEPLCDLRGALSRQGPAEARRGATPTRSAALLQNQLLNRSSLQPPLSAARGAGVLPAAARRPRRWQPPRALAQKGAHCRSPPS
jgi:hypothetical protein